MQRNFLTLATLSLILSACTDSGTIGNEGAAGSPVAIAGSVSTGPTIAGAPGSGGTGAGGTSALAVVGGATAVATDGGKAGGATNVANSGQAGAGIQNGGQGSANVTTTSSGQGGAIVASGGQAGATDVAAGSAGALNQGGSDAGATARAGAAGMRQLGGAGGVSQVGGAHSSLAGNTSAAGQAGALANAELTLANCGITTAEPLTWLSLAIPADLATAEPQARWVSMLDVCKAGGWDLTQCQGVDATWATANTIPSTSVINPPQSVTYVASGDKVCCVLLTENAPGAGIPAHCGPKMLELAQNALSGCKIQNDGHPKVQEIEIPTELTGPNWTIKKNACQKGGWDLAKCSGSNATFTSFSTSRESRPGHPLTAWVVTQNSQVCCIYESDDANPGIYSATCAK